jgi:8-hydroxy-5-deazaflavin:NADPH oxidoreductase
MQIAVIGAGNVGTAVSRAAVAAGHSVTISAADPEHAAAAAAATGAAAAASNAEAARGADLVVFAVPGSAVSMVADEIADTVAGGVVVDSTNPLNASFTDLDIAGASGAADLQARLPQAKVVKAFNTVFAARHAAPTENGEPLDLYIAGDDADAKAKVAEFGASLGFDPLDVGGLRLARSLEELALLNITLNATKGWVWQSAWKLVGPKTGR